MLLMSWAGIPSTVSPGEPSRRLTLPERRSTGVGSPSCAKCCSDAACRTGTSLVGLAAGERRAVRLREEREPEADDEERDGDRGAARVPGERQRCEPYGHG